MRILVISDKSPTPPNSGGALAVESMILLLRKGAIDLDLLAITTPKHPNVEETQTISKFEKIGFQTQFINTRINPFKLIYNILFSSVPYNCSRFWSGNMKSRLKKILTPNSYDIVQLEGINLAPYIRVIRELCTSKIVFRAHNVEGHIWKGLSSGTKNIFRRLFLKYISNKTLEYELDSISRCDALVTISESDLLFFRERGINIPSINISYAIASIPQYNPPESREKVPGIIASLDWGPNQEGIIWFFEEVWSEAKEKSPGIRLKIAGRNPPDWLKKRFIKERVNYLGEVESADDFLKKCSVLIIPLLSGSGMRIRIIQALALGIPVITSRIGASGLNLSESDGVYISDTSLEMRNHISLLAGNSKLRDQAGDAGRNYIIRNHIISNLAPVLTKFYMKIIS